MAHQPAHMERHSLAEAGKEFLDGNCRFTLKFLEAAVASKLGEAFAELRKAHYFNVKVEVAEAGSSEWAHKYHLVPAINPLKVVVNGLEVASIPAWAFQRRSQRYFSDHFYLHSDNLKKLEPEVAKKFKEVLVEAMAFSNSP